MQLQELKKIIETGLVPKDFIILIIKDNTFLAKQYMKALIKNAKNNINKLKSIYELQYSTYSLLVAPTSSLNIIYTDIFDERSEDYSQFKNTIIVCNDIDKDLKPVVENYIVSLPKLESWQILDYGKQLCPFIDEHDLQWLIDITNSDIDRVDNELNKISIFNTKQEQLAIFSAIRDDSQTDLFQLDIFKVVNALVDGDLLFLYNTLTNKSLYSLDAVVLANRTFTSLKKILLVTQKYGLDLKTINVTEKQRAFLIRKYNNLNIEAVRQKIKFLTNLDVRLKTSQLDLDKQAFINYLIANLAYKIVY